MAGLKFDITGDNGNMLSALQGVQNGVRETQRVVEQSGQSIEDIFDKAKDAATAMIGAFSAQQLVSKIMDVRGEFQQLEVAFTTMLGSASKANTLMNQLVQTAATTPFDLKSVSEGAKQLLAYGTQAEDVNGTLIRLGDIAAGLSIPLNDLVYLYGTTMTQGRMFTQDLRQFQGRGIPIADELAKIFGTTKDKVGELVTAGKVGAAEVQKAIENMTNAGSRFGGLMEAQSHTITGQISNIEDAIDTMFNSIGKSSEGVINTSLSSVSYLVEHWEAIGKVVLEVAVAYGTYKAALLAVYAAHKVQAIYNTISAFFSLTKSVNTAKDAMLLFNMTTKANPIGLIISVIASAAAAFYLFSKNTDNAAKAQENLAKIQEEAAGRASEEKAKIDLLVTAAKNEKLSLEERRKAIQKLNAIIPHYNAQLDATTNKYKENRDALNDYLKSLAHKYEIEGAKEKLKDIGKKIAEINIRKTKAEQEKKNADALAEKSFTRSAWSVAPSQAETSFINAKTGSALNNINKANEDLKAAFAERKLIYDTYGIDLQKDAVSSTSENSTNSTGSGKKVLQEKIKSLEDELNALSEQEAAGRKGLELKKKIAQLKKRENVYNISGGNAASEIAKEREKRFELQQKWDEEDLEQVNRASTARSEVELEQIKNAHDKELLQLNLAHKQTLKQFKKQEADYKKANLSRQKELWNLNNNDKSKSFYDTSEGKAGWAAQKLTKEQERELIALREKEELEYSKKIEKLQEEEIKNNTEAMRLVLEKYGQFGEQKVAIAMETAQKIAEIEKSGDSDNVKKWKVEEVKREEEKRINSTEADAALQQIDWFTVFGNVGGLMKDALAPLLENLKAFVGTDKFNNLGADQQKQIVDAMNNIRNQVGSNADVSWRELALDMTNFQKSVRIANEATKDYDDLQKRLNPAIGKLSKSILKYTEEGNIDAARSAQTELNMYTSQLYESGKKVERANKDVVSSNRKLSMSAKAVAQPIDDIHLFLQNTGLSQLQQVWDGFNQIKGAAKGLKAIKEAAEGVDSISDAAKDGAKGLKNIGSVVSDALGEGLSKAGLIGQIIAAILKILDVLKEGIGTLVSSILDSILGAVSGIINNILSGKFVTQIIGSLVKGIGGILNSIIGNLGHILSFGALNRDAGKWFTGSNEKEVAEKTEALTKSNEYLQKSIDELRNSIDKSNGDTAISNYEKAYEYQKQVIANQAEILRTQMGYHSAHKSNSYYWDGDIKERDYDVINKILANYKKNNPVSKTISDTVYSQDDMYKLTPEQMMEIKTKDVSLWRRILDVGKYDKSDYWEKYVELAGKLEELTEKVNENLTKTTFSSLHDNFVSTLMDMDKSASDFSENFSEMMAKAWLNAAVANLMDSDLKKLQEKWAEKMKVADKDGNPAKLSKEDVDELRNDYNKLVDKGLALRPILSEITGYNGNGNKEQSASANGVSSITFEQATSIIGLTTAGNISRDQIKDLLASIMSNIASMSVLYSSTNTIVVEIKNLMITNNSYLEDILKCSKSIYRDFAIKIDDINKNLKELK